MPQTPAAIKLRIVVPRSKSSSGIDRRTRRRYEKEIDTRCGITGIEDKAADSLAMLTSDFDKARRGQVVQSRVMERHKRYRSHK